MHGRPLGAKNKVTIEAREAAARIVDDPEYRERLRQRMIDGTAGAIEMLLWRFAKGSPPDRVDHGDSGTLAKLSGDELKARLAAAIAALS